jgi:hypothetical protein
MEAIPMRGPPAESYRLGGDASIIAVESLLGVLQMHLGKGVELLQQFL